MRYNGKIVDPGSINWGSVNMASIAFVQAPGPTNVLGKLKFLYPNKHIVYMHDTIKPNLFKTAMRAEGHNCIRMEKPTRLAEIVLAEDKGWDTKKIQDLLAKGYNAAVGLDRPFPVHTTYFTAAVDDKGNSALSATCTGSTPRWPRCRARKIRDLRAARGHEQRPAAGGRGRAAAAAEEEGSGGRELSSTCRGSAATVFRTMTARGRRARVGARPPYRNG